MKTVEIKKNPRGGYYAVDINDCAMNTLHCTKKTIRGAVAHAKRLWGNGVHIVMDKA